VVSKSNDWSRLEHEFIHEDWLVNNLDKFSLDVLYFGVNIKNKISGMATIGNSDTRSFYDKESNTCHIRADIGSNLPSINSAFNVIVFYMNLHYYINNSEVICRFLMFAYDALRFDGEIRIVLPHKNNFVDFLLEYPEIVSYLNFCGFSGLSQEKFNPQIDLLPTSRYDAAYIIKAIK
jgi:hypothetical protein